MVIHGWDEGLCCDDGDSGFASEDLNPCKVGDEFLRGGGAIVDCDGWE